MLYTCYVCYGGTLSYQVEADSYEEADEKAEELFNQEDEANVLNGARVIRIDTQEVK